MNDKDIIKLAAKLTESLATKDDIKGVKDDIKRIEQKFDGKFKELNEKADTILEFAEHVDETVFEHEKKLKDIERIPVIAHELRKN